MPAKDVEKYIIQAISSIQAVRHIEWELIVIEDHSSDNTFLLVEQNFRNDSRIRLYKNEGRGKVSALNMGYGMAQGSIIKFIDSDDILLPRYFDFFEKLKQYPAHCHNYLLVDESLTRLSSYIVHPLFLTGSYDTVCRELISIPRATWSFNRAIAEKVFPIPNDLPFEDVWFSLVIKRYAKEIFYIRENLYLYRQHNGQEWGGMINFSKEKVNFRSQWMLQVIDVLLRNKDRLTLSSKDVFEYSIGYHSLQAGDFSFRKILFSSLRVTHKVKLTFICFFPSVAPFITKVKWRLDNFLNK